MIVSITIIGNLCIYHYKVKCLINLFMLDAHLYNFIYKIVNFFKCMRIWEILLVSFLSYFLIGSLGIRMPIAKVGMILRE